MMVCHTPCTRVHLTPLRAEVYQIPYSDEISLSVSSRYSPQKWTSFFLHEDNFTFQYTPVYQINMLICQLHIIL